MITAFPVPETERSAKAMLRMLIEQAHVDESSFSGKFIFSAMLEGWQIDLLSSYCSTSEDLEDSDDEEDQVSL